MKNITYDMIVATDANWNIGKDNKLLFQIPEDQHFFKDITARTFVVMGKHTKDSIEGGYLKNRVNYILTSSKQKNGDAPETEYHADTYEMSIVKYVNNVSMLSELIYNDALSTVWVINKKPIVIGGAETYKYFLENNLVDRVFLTQTDSVYEADASIPNLYEMGFRYDENDSRNVKTRFVEPTKSLDGIHRFTIRTLVR